MRTMKLVPDAEPNADGEWVDVPRDVDLGRRFTDHVAAVSHLVPGGYHVVAFDVALEPASRE